MNREIILTPEELFYLGKMLKAKYIDYSYIAEMKDIRQNADAVKQDAMRDLMGKNYLTEDFSGEVIIDETVTELLDPVFFGEFESNASLCRIEDKAYVTTMRFHRHGERMVLALFRDDGLHISDLSDDELKRYIVSLVPSGYFKKELQAAQKVTKAEIKQVFAFKNNFIGEKAEVKVFFESGGWLCFESDGSVSIVSGAYFCDEAYRILKGV